jgi:hypothetical protein
LDYAVEISYVDSQLQGAGGNDDEIAAFGECFFGLKALIFT